MIAAALPVDDFLPVDFPGNLARKWEPPALVPPIVAEASSPRRRQNGRCGRTRPVGGICALDPPVAFSSVSRDGGRTWSLARPEPDLYNTISKGFYGRDSLGRHVYVYNDDGPHVRKALRYVVQAANGTWSSQRTFYDGHVRNSYPTLIEDLTPGTFLCVWDSSNQIDRIRTSIRFGRLKLVP